MGWAGVEPQLPSFPAGGYVALELRAGSSIHPHRDAHVDAVAMHRFVK